MTRLFVGLELPDPLKDQLTMAMGGVGGVRWQSFSQLHLTLRFIGDVDLRCADDIRAALGLVTAEPFDLRLGGAGYFGKPHAPHTLWTGVENPDPVKHLHEKIDQALVRVGVPPEQRKYKPHVTLARAKRGAGIRLDRFIAYFSGLSLPAVRLSRMALFESHLTSDGAVYDVIESYPLDPLELEVFDDGFHGSEIGWAECPQMEEQWMERV